jgi:hypothetical protein
MAGTPQRSASSLNSQRHARSDAVDDFKRFGLATGCGPNLGLALGQSAPSANGGPDAVRGQIQLQFRTPHSEIIV